MRRYLFIPSIFISGIYLYSCKKNTDNLKNGCDPGAPTTRQVLNKKATVKLTATYTYPVYLVEEGTIDTKLIPCNFPPGTEYYQDGLQVIISGEVKMTASAAYGPCCSESFFITNITK